MSVDVAAPSLLLRTPPRRARTHPYALARPARSQRAMSLSLGVDLSFTGERAPACALSAPAGPAATAPSDASSLSASLSAAAFALGPYCAASDPAQHDDADASAARLAPYLAPGPSFSLLTPHLALGDLAFAEDAAALRRAGVTHVVSVVGQRVHVPAHIPPARRLHVPLPDAPFAELVGALAPVVAWVRAALAAGGVLPREAPDADGAPMAMATEAEGHAAAAPVRVLVHCVHGISRSAAVGAALLVALPLVAASEHGPAGKGTTLSAAAALAYVAAHRPAADVNWGFRAQLAEWERVCGG